MHPLEAGRSTRAVTVARDPATSTEAVTSPAELPQRRCGRCRCDLPADPTLFFQTDWVLCSPCEAVLLPRRSPGQTE